MPGCGNVPNRTSAETENRKSTGPFDSGDPSVFSVPALPSLHSVLSLPFLPSASPLPGSASSVPLSAKAAALFAAWMDGTWTVKEVKSQFSETFTLNID